MGLAALSVCLPLTVSAQDNIKKLENFQTTGVSLNMETIAQNGAKADALRANLKNVKLPPGFKIDLYALVPDARHMAVGPPTGIVSVGTRKTQVYAVTDRAKTRVGDEVKAFSPSISRKVPMACVSRPTAYCTWSSTIA